MDIIFTTIILVVLFRVIKTKDNGLFSNILLLGFFLRLVLLICTCTDIVPVPDAHMDADTFHETALAHPGFFDSEDQWTNYTRWLTFIYLITDDSRWFAQFLNVALGVMILVYLRRILCVLNVQAQITKRILLLATLMPFLNIYSVVLMREAWITFFVMLSLYFFICWYLGMGNGGCQIVRCIIAIMLAMWMHAGVIGIMFGYFLAFITYYRNGDKIRISKSSYVAFFFLAIFVFVMLLNINTLLSKFAVEDFGNYAAAKSSGEGGGSDYLTWLDLSSPSKILMFLPLKMFYFLYSPVVLEWRGLNDVAAFALDSSVYLIISWYILTRKAAVPQYRLIKRFLFISLITTTLLFSIGTSNTGTAIRHRAKLFPLFLVVLSISSERKKQSCNTYLYKHIDDGNN